MCVLLWQSPCEQTRLSITTGEKDVLFCPNLFWWWLSVLLMIDINFDLLTEAMWHRQQQRRERIINATSIIDQQRKRTRRQSWWQMSKPEKKRFWFLPPTETRIIRQVSQMDAPDRRTGVFLVSKTVIYRTNDGRTRLVCKFWTQLDLTHPDRSMDIHSWNWVDLESDVSIQEAASSVPQQEHSGQIDFQTWPSTRLHKQMQMDIHCRKAETFQLDVLFKFLSHPQKAKQCLGLHERWACLNTS